MFEAAKNNDGDAVNVADAAASTNSGSGPPPQLQAPENDSYREIQHLFALCFDAEKDPDDREHLGELNHQLIDKLFSLPEDRKHLVDEALPLLKRFTEAQTQHYPTTRNRTEETRKIIKELIFLFLDFHKRPL
jgi:hypothetical protein